MPELRLLPTGGINLSNLEHYFTAGATAVGVGGSLVNRKAVAGKDWKKISELAAAYSEKCNVAE
jgi:2-dehydro-3-deoxyphosphogluconate aldolase/(4S)-4-hydroxy-2-oxoglutarate aldolase